MSRMILQIMGAVAEFERSLILERQREGIALAKKEGKYKGRKPLPAHIVAAIREKTALGVPCARIARELHIGESSVRRYRSAVTP